MKLEDYITVREAARITGVKYKTLLKRIEQGRLAAERVGDKILMIAKTDIPKIKNKASGAAQ